MAAHMSLKELEEAVERAVKRALAEARAENMKAVADAIASLAEYTREGFRKVFEILEGQGKLLEEHGRLLERHSKLLERHSELLEEHSRLLKEHGARLSLIEQRLSSVELGVGALTESFYSKAALEDVQREAAGRGEKVLSWERNAVIDGEEVDLLVETESAVYVVEVKVKPRVESVGALLAKAEVVAKSRPGKEVRPVLAGAMIGSSVRSYAEQKGVKVLSY